MLFNSFNFLLFFPIVTIIYFLLPHKFRWFHLLVASCFFYMVFVPVFILILFGTIIIDYVAGIMIENATGTRKKLFLVMSIVANVGVLAFFKYFNFFADNFNQLFHLANLSAHIPLLHILLPIGLSFHTFQAMSYTIEVYRGNQKAERHLGIYSLYVMFYPQLVAGPIERPQNMLHQFYEKHDFSYEKAVSGMRLAGWGMFKKVVIADRIGMVTEPVFNNVHGYSGTTFAFAAMLFAYQLYCDFSGYSDIALGTARVMGFELMLNFDRPFSSKSVSEIWRRWHISLSTWFNEYFFNPLALAIRDWNINAVAVALMITFTVCGFWHGAAWNFVVFGLMHGVALTYEFLTKKQRKKLFKKLPLWLNNGLSKVITFSFFSFSCIYFRARNLSEAFYITKKLCHIPVEFFNVLRTHRLAFLHLPPLGLLGASVGLVLLLEAYQVLQHKYKMKEVFAGWPIYWRWAVYYIFLAVIVFIGVFEQRQFIYFQF